MIRISLTGPSGMLGQHVYQFLSEKGLNIKKVTRNDWNLKDLEANFENIFSNTDLIIHCACIVNGEEKNSDNMLYNFYSSKQLGSWLSKKDIKIIFISGSTIYKFYDKQNIIEEDELAYLPFGGMYGLSKNISEQIFNYYLYETGRLAVLRPSSIYGSGLNANALISKLVISFLNNKRIEIDDEGIIFNLVHAKDIARAIYSLILNWKPMIFNLPGFNYSIQDIIASFETIDPSNSKNFVIRKKNNNPSYRYSLNGNKIYNELKFKSEIKINDGLQEMINSDLIFGNSSI